MVEGQLWLYTGLTLDDHNGGFPVERTHLSASSKYKSACNVGDICEGDR